MLQSIYQIYASNEHRLGFFVRRDTWDKGCRAKVIQIEFVSEGDVCCEDVDSKKMVNGFVTLEAEWLIGGIVEIDSGGERCWERVGP